MKAYSFQEAIIIQIPALQPLLQPVFRSIDWSANNSLSRMSLRRRIGGLFRRPAVLGAENRAQHLRELQASGFLVSKCEVALRACHRVTPEFATGHVAKDLTLLRAQRAAVNV